MFISQQVVNLLNTEIAILKIKSLLGRFQCDICLINDKVNSFTHNSDGKIMTVKILFDFLVVSFHCIVLNDCALKSIIESHKCHKLSILIFCE